MNRLTAAFQFVRATSDALNRHLGLPEPVHNALTEKGYSFQIQPKNLVEAPNVPVAAWCAFWEEVTTPQHEVVTPGSAAEKQYRADRRAIAAAIYKPGV